MDWVWACGLGVSEAECAPDGMKCIELAGERWSLSSGYFALPLSMAVPFAAAGAAARWQYGSDSNAAALPSAVSSSRRIVRSAMKVALITCLVLTALNEAATARKPADAMPRPDQSRWRTSVAHPVRTSISTWFWHRPLRPTTRYRADPGSRSHRRPGPSGPKRPGLRLTPPRGYRMQQSPAPSEARRAAP